jgi:hypothetical protein
MYLSKKQNSSVGRMIRERMGYENAKSDPSPKTSAREKNTFSPDRSNKKSNKQVRIADEPDVEYSWKRASQKAKDTDFERDNSKEDEIARLIS